MIKKLSRIFIIILWLFTCIWVWTTSYDLGIANITLSNGGWSTIAKSWIPDILVMVRNYWDDIAHLNNIPAWFIQCSVEWEEVWKTNVIQELIINESTEIGVGVSLSPLITATNRTVDILCNITHNDGNQWNNSRNFALTVTEGSNYNSTLEETTASIRSHLNPLEPKSTEWWWSSIKNFIFNLISNVFVPIIVLAGIIMWIIWWYQVVTSDSAETLKKWIMNIVFGIVGILIILSAKYIWTVIFDQFEWWNLLELDSIDLAKQLYERIAYPFIKIAIYLSLGVLFLILAGKTVSIVMNGDTKKAGTIILWTIVSILIIIWAKQLVEAIYGKQAEILNSDAINLWEIWTWILADKSIPLVYNIINWVIWITALVILILIIVHTFKILTNPGKSDNWQSLGKALLYIFIWIMVIGAGYLLTNLLIIN